MLHQQPTLRRPPTTHQHSSRLTSSPPSFLPSFSRSKRAFPPSVPSYPLLACLCVLQRPRACGAWGGEGWMDGRLSRGKKEEGLLCLAFHKLLTPPPPTPTPTPPPHRLRLRTRVVVITRGKMVAGESWFLRFSLPSLPPSLASPPPPLLAMWSLEGQGVRAYGSQALYCHHWQCVHLYLSL